MIQVDAIWLRRIGDHAEVLVKAVNGSWHVAIRERVDGAFSHIAEAGGVSSWPHDGDEDPARDPVNQPENIR